MEKYGLLHISGVYGKKDEKWDSPVPVPLWFEQVQQALGVELIVLDDNLGLECDDYKKSKGTEKVCEQIKNGLNRQRLFERNKKEMILYIVAISRSAKLPGYL